MVVKANPVKIAPATIAAPKPPTAANNAISASDNPIIFCNKLLVMSGELKLIVIPVVLVVNDKLLVIVLLVDKVASEFDTPMFKLLMEPLIESLNVL